MVVDVAKCDPLIVDLCIKIVKKLSYILSATVVQSQCLGCSGPGFKNDRVKRSACRL